MICKHCGLEYPDDLDACPGCGASNDDVEAQVLSEEERDSFSGVTIETGPEESSRDDYRVYDQEDLRRKEQQQARKARWRRIWDLVKLNGRAVLVLALIIFCVIFLLPTLLGFALIGLGVFLVLMIFRKYFAGW
jgi:predicted ATP-dependent serine protease